MRAIDVRDLLETPGSSRSVHVEEPVPGLRTELADVPEDTPIAADLTLESVVEGIFVRGSLEGRFAMRCARCLKTFERDFDVEMTELVARLKAVLRRRNGVGLHVQCYADLTLNTSTREVRRGDRPIELTVREYALLECLLRTPGRAVTRVEISQSVWGHQFDAGTNFVDVAV